VKLTAEKRFEDASSIDAEDANEKDLGERTVRREGKI
jgi:hypothetical protein